MADKKWFASQYLDTDEWGIVDDENKIIVGIASRITLEIAREITHNHNCFADLLQALKEMIDCHGYPGPITNHAKQIIAKAEEK